MNKVFNIFDLDLKNLDPNYKSYDKLNITKTILQGESPLPQATESNPAVVVLDVGSKSRTRSREIKEVNPLPMFKLWPHTARGSLVFLTNTLIHKFNTIFNLIFLKICSNAKETFMKLGFYNFTKADARYLKNSFLLLKQNLQFGYQSLIDLCVVDLLGQPGLQEKQARFELNYVLYSYTYNFRIVICCYCGEYTHVFSLFNIYASSVWLEREVWDMFGIKFINHPDLRRLLTDYGFRGFPLRKDFPNVGFKQVRFDERANSVIYEPVTLMQEERELVLINPWQGVTVGFTMSLMEVRFNRINKMSLLLNFFYKFLLKVKLNINNVCTKYSVLGWLHLLG